MLYIHSFLIAFFLLRLYAHFYIAGYSVEVQSLVRDAQQQAQKGKRLLDSMKSRGSKLAAAAGGTGSAEMQLQRSQYMETCRVYMDAVNDHQQAKMQFKEVCSDRAIERARVVFPEMSEDQIQEVRQ